ncbi:MAG: 4-(cytidine 5'-diphospho)-2-C-methyl-D-erythritol kinase [Clostridiales bacterium]|nr:4-(cytidine 5'-diphospho)-2-C-methyl-D-erythritol kinase [Clostridiales bacterium]
MKKITVKVPAKINLTLDVLGAKNGYHQISSLVASIDVYDTITAKKRTDGKITVLNKGLPVDCPIIENNAYKASKLFIDTFGTYGVDIIIDKKIPVGGGLGGSSADIAGVLNALNALYEINGDMSPLASDLGSDATYMLSGGYAVIKNRGEQVEKKDIDKKIYLLLITENGQISARNAYKKFDQKKKFFEPSTDLAVDALYQGDFESAKTHFKNDLYQSACELLPAVKNNVYNLQKAGANTTLLAGSGPTVLGIFGNKNERDVVYKKLIGLYGENLIKAQTVIPKNDKFI